MHSHYKRGKEKRKFFKCIFQKCVQRNGKSMAQRIGNVKKFGKKNLKSSKFKAFQIKRMFLKSFNKSL